jgi:hypothetical protein
MGEPVLIRTSIIWCVLQGKSSHRRSCHTASMASTLWRVWQEGHSIPLAVGDVACFHVGLLLSSYTPCCRLTCTSLPMMLQALGSCF